MTGVVAVFDAGREPALPTDMRADLELLDEHRFSNGLVPIRYRLV
jgi:hypothetical protein